MWIAHSRVCVQSGIQSGVYHNVYIRRVESVSTRVRCTLGYEYNQMSTISCMYQESTIKHGMNSLLLLLCQRTPIATCNRRNSYYTYRYQSRSQVIGTDRLKTLFML